MNAMLELLHDVLEWPELPMPELRDPPWSPLPPLGLEQVESDIFTAIRRRDVTSTSRYDSFDAGIKRLFASSRRSRSR